MFRAIKTWGKKLPNPGRLENVQKGEMEKKGNWRKKQNRKTFYIHLFSTSSFFGL